MTNYGRQVLEKMIPGLVNDNWTIVSGMMYGVDETAHRLCLEYGGKTIGVLGWGIKYQQENKEQELEKRIIDAGGLIISEWEDQAGTLWTFPRRDRILAALASDIYVVEAGIKSGTKYTVDWANKIGRQVWAVPGPVTSRVSEGTNKLIIDGLAKIWTPDNKIEIRDKEDTQVYLLLQNEALTVDELVQKTSRPASDIGAELTLMMLKGDINEREGKYYIC